MTLFCGCAVCVAMTARKKGARMRRRLAITNFILGGYCFREGMSDVEDDQSVERSFHRSPFGFSSEYGFHVTLWREFSNVTLLTLKLRSLNTTNHRSDLHRNRTLSKTLPC